MAKYELEIDPIFIPGNIMGTALQQLDLLMKKGATAEEQAKAVAELASGFENRLPHLPAVCKSVLTRISTDTPNASHYKVFCNDKELSGCIFADVPAAIAVCYQVEKRGSFITPLRSEDGHIKTTIHHGQIEIRKQNTLSEQAEMQEDYCTECEAAKIAFAKYGRDVPEDFVCSRCYKKTRKQQTID